MAADPLASLLRQIEEAASLPAAEPYVPTGDPLGRLRAQLRDEPANDDRAAAAPGGGLESILGREVLEMAASTPLAGVAREEAIRRLAIAVEHPTVENVRAVLRVVLTGRTDA